MNWDGSVYSTSKSFFNGRDQVTLQRQYAGADSSSTFQDTTATYDGYGRLKTNHRPEQNTGTATTYNYFNDDRIQQIVDARGATVNYTYDNRGLTTQVSTTSPNTAVIPVTPTVTYSYDNLGNRTQMTDGLGTQTYEYNQLSQLTAETRQFNDNLPNSPMANNSFRLEYGYSISGQLKSYKDPYNRQFDFGFDKIGRNTSIDGTAYAGVTNYSSNQQYRAFGSLKQVSYGNQTTATMTYNNRLQPNSYRLNDATQTLFGKDYFYTTGSNNDNDGLLKKSVHYDATMTTNEQAKRNQVNTYDAQGRVKTSQTGEPNLTPFGSLKNGPYQQTFDYDAFGNLTNKNDMDFGLNQIGCVGCPRSISYWETVVNNRTQNSNLIVSGSAGQNITTYQYDANGRLINRGGVVQNFDVAGQMVFRDDSGTNPDDTFTFDGNGERAKWIQTGGSFNYYLRSSVLGADLLQLDSSGAMFKEYVYSPNGTNIAFLSNNEVIWNYHEPSGKEIDIPTKLKSSQATLVL